MRHPDALDILKTSYREDLMLPVYYKKFLKTLVAAGIEIHEIQVLILHLIIIRALFLQSGSVPDLKI